MWLSVQILYPFYTNLFCVKKLLAEVVCWFSLLSSFLAFHDQEEIFNIFTYSQYRTCLTQKTFYRTKTFNNNFKI